MTANGTHDGCDAAALSTHLRRPKASPERVDDPKPPTLKR